MFSDVLGKNAYVTNTVQRVLGRPPRDFTDYAARTAATGMWTPPADRSHPPSHARAGGPSDD